MHYWNQDNFEGLLRLAEELEGDARLRPLADYCRFRERGLRREAFGALEAFLSSSRAFDPSTARATALRILEANARTAEAHQFLATPLRQRFLLPTLVAWMQEDPDTHLPVRWLGILRHEKELLGKALAMCPSDLPVRRRLVSCALGDLDQATHHLDESFLIGTVEEAVTTLEEARALIEGGADQEALADLTSELQYFDRLIADWKSYSESPRGTFPEWCAMHGRNYAFPIKVYYPA